MAAPEHDFIPTSLDLSIKDQLLSLTWADGFSGTLELAKLRAECPCAACRTERENRTRTLLPVLKADPGEPIEATGAHLVGNYALAIDWSDGHNSGIYDFRLLRELAAR